MSKKPLQWHPAFQAVLQIEFIEDREHLQFLKEYNLTEKPLRIDTLVIKMEPGRVIRKKIGRIFRQYNVVEYKGPDDYHSINDFYKVIGYTSILQSNTKKEQEIPPEELTITLAGNRYPGKLIRFLKKKYHVTVSEVYPGIYYVWGLMFPVQILVQSRLSSQENLWLSRLRRNLKKDEDIEELAKAYVGKEKDPLYSAAMDLIVRANWKAYKEESDMCDALNELFEEKYAEKLEAMRETVTAEVKEAVSEEIKAKVRAESVIELLTDLGPVPPVL